METKALEEGGNDEVITATPTRRIEDQTIPYIPHEIMTRSKAQQLKGRIQTYVHKLREQEEVQEEQRGDTRTCNLGDKVLCVLTIR